MRAALRHRSIRERSLQVGGLPLLRSSEQRIVGFGSLDGRMTVTRGQTAGVQSSALAADNTTREYFAANTVRFNGSRRGLRVEPQRTNAILNPRAEGLVAGSPGTLPTAWSQQAIQGGISRTLAAASVNGMTGVSWRLSGTASNTTPTNLEFAAARNSAPAASPSQRRVGSVFIRLAPGSSLTGVSNVSINILGMTAAGAAVAGNQSQLQIRSQIDTTLRRFVLPVAFTSDVTIARSILRVLVTVTNGSSADCTLEVYFPQDEPDAVNETSPILPPVGAPAAATRGADIVQGALSGFGIPATGRGRYFLRGLLPKVAPSSGVQMIAQIDDGSDSNRYLIRNEAGGPFLSLYRVTAGVASIAAVLGIVTANQPFELEWNLDGNGNVSASLVGGIAVSLFGGPTSGLSRIMLGSSGVVGGSEAMNGEILSFVAVP